MKIAELPLEERPREKALCFGISSLSDAELLALCIGKGTKGIGALELSYRLLGRYGSLLSLTQADLPSLTQEKGIKNVKGLQLLATLELAKRVQSKERYFQSYAPDRLYASLKLGAGDVEELKLYYLDGKGQIKGEAVAFTGTDSTLAPKSKDILSLVMRSGKTRFVIAHNHPSGVALPSQDDITFTSKLEKEAKGLDLNLIDHLIYTGEGYFSFAENDLLHIQQRQ